MRAAVESSEPTTDYVCFARVAVLCRALVTALVLLFCYKWDSARCIYEAAHDLCVMPITWVFALCSKRNRKDGKPASVPQELPAWGRRDTSELTTSSGKTSMRSLERV